MAYKQIDTNETVTSYPVHWETYIIFNTVPRKGSTFIVSNELNSDSIFNPKSCLIVRWSSHSFPTDFLYSAMKIRPSGISLLLYIPFLISAILSVVSGFYGLSKFCRLYKGEPTFGILGIYILFFH